MAKDYEFMVRQAMEHPDSTAAIGLRAIADERLKARASRKKKFKNLFKKASADESK